jgi:hypothetical protein
VPTTVQNSNANSASTRDLFEPPQEESTIQKYANEDVRFFSFLLTLCQLQDNIEQLRAIHIPPGLRVAADHLLNTLMTGTHTDPEALLICLHAIYTHALLYVFDEIHSGQCMDPYSAAFVFSRWKGGNQFPDPKRLTPLLAHKQFAIRAASTLHILHLHEESLQNMGEDPKGFFGYVIIPSMCQLLFT